MRAGGERPWQARRPRSLRHESAPPRSGPKKVSGTLSIKEKVPDTFFVPDAHGARNAAALTRGADS